MEIKEKMKEYQTREVNRKELSGDIKPVKYSIEIVNLLKDSETLLSISKELMSKQVLEK